MDWLTVAICFTAWVGGDVLFLIALMRFGNRKKKRANTG